jgi:hypothetical protein
MSKYKNGDIGLVSRKFKFTLGGLVQMFIRFFQNLIYVITFQFRKISIYHHVFSIVEVDGKLMVYEAIDTGYVMSGDLETYLNDPTMHKYLIKRVKDETLLDLKAYVDCQNSMLGLKYWYGGTLGYQWIKQSTFDLVWLGGNPTGCGYCSHLGAKGLHAGTYGRLFKRYFATDPQDIYVSKDLVNV